MDDGAAALELVVELEAGMELEFVTDIVGVEWFFFLKSFLSFLG